MSFSVGITGLPNVGKSTLFKALTRQPVDISNYPFCTINPNVGIVEVPDERLKKLAEVLKPPKITPTVIEFVDIAGLVRGAHKGEGLGNQFLSRIQEVDAILEIVRAFEDPQIEHVEKTVDPERDIEIIKNELIMRDLGVIEKIFDDLQKETKSGLKEAIRNFEIVQRLKSACENNELPLKNFNQSEIEFIRKLGLLTTKPIIYLLNLKEDSTISTAAKIAEKDKGIELDLKFEEEISELSDAEVRELNLESKLSELIKLCYNALNLVTFYTIKGGRELRAWTLKKGFSAPEAGGVVHTDFNEKFIRAEVVNWEILWKMGSWQACREKGLIKTVGKEYVVEDGDVLEFKI